MRYNVRWRWPIYAKRQIRGSIVAAILLVEDEDQVRVLADCSYKRQGTPPSLPGLLNKHSRSLLSRAD